MLYKRLYSYLKLPCINYLFKIRYFSNGSQGDKTTRRDVSVDKLAPDRCIGVPVELSIEYMNSEAYKQCYGDEPIWKYYRRNYKGHFLPRKTRITCIRNGVISTGSPCPICRDEYLTVDYQNTKLLEQFICKHTGAVLDMNKVGVCQFQYRKLLVAIEKAKDYGYIVYDVPFRIYNYSDYYEKFSHLCNIEKNL